MARRLFSAVLVLMLAVPMLAPMRASAVARQSALARALDYLHARQYANGGFGEKGRGSSEQLTAWGIVAIAAAGENPNTWRRGPNSPVSYLSRMSSKWRTTTDFARTALAAAAAGQDPHDFGGVNLVAKIKDAVRSDGANGDHIGTAVNSHVWGMLALRACGETINDDYVRWLKNQQNGDGGWGWGINTASDTNDTAAAIQALMAAGESRSSSAVRNAVAYLRRKQRTDGGFAYWGSASDSGSTSWVIQGLAAAREPLTGQAWRKGRHTPLSRLAALQALGGALRYTASRVQNPLFMTVQAIPAFAMRPFPVPFSRYMAATRKAGPALRALSPAPNSSLPRGTSVRVRVKLTDPAGGTGIAASTVKVRIDGRSTPVSVKGEVANASAGALGTGVYAVTVQAADRAGNVSTLSGWRFGVGATVAQNTTNLGDPEAGTSQSTTAAPGMPGATTTDQAQGGMVAPGAETSVPGQTGGQTGQPGNVDKWSDAVEVESPGGMQGSTTLKDIGIYALIGLVLFIPTVGALALITWFSKRRARRKKQKRQEREAAQQTAAAEAQQQAGLSAPQAAPASDQPQQGTDYAYQQQEQTAVWPQEAAEATQAYEPQQPWPQEPAGEQQQPEPGEQQPVPFHADARQSSQQGTEQQWPPPTTPQQWPPRDATQSWPPRPEQQDASESWPPQSEQRPAGEADPPQPEQRPAGEAGASQQEQSPGRQPDRRHEES